MISEENLAIYKKLFRRRQDIYAVRWEKDRLVATNASLILEKGKVEAVSGMLCIV